MYFIIMQTIENKVTSRIYGHGRGWVFSQIDFGDIGPRSTIDWILTNLEKKATIKESYEEFIIIRKIVLY